MAKALVRPRGGRGRTFGRHARELKRLLLSVCDDIGFRLYLATYDQPETRDKLIARVAQEAEAEKVRVVRLDLAEAKPETNLVGLLRARLQEADLPPGWRQAVMVTGIERHLDYGRGREGYAFLHQANLLRDVLPEAAPVPVVLWLSRMASAALPVEAPDLWHWRAANFDFTGDEAPRVEVLRELTILRPEDDVGLSGEQRRARITMLENLLEELERKGPPESKRQKAERAAIFLDLGIEARHLGRPAEARSHVEQALSIYREIGFKPGEGLMLRMLGGAWQQLGEPRRAIEFYEQYLAVAREIGDRLGEGAALRNLGSAWADLGETHRALDCYEQSLAVAREIGDREGEGAALGGLGNTYANLGEMRRAIDYYEQGLAMARGIGDQRGEGIALADLGDICVNLGEMPQAIKYYEQSLAVARDSGRWWAESIALGKLGSAYLSMGEPQQAIEYSDRALAVAREIGTPQGEGNALFTSARFLNQLGERNRAIGRMEEALAIFERIGARHLAERAGAKLAEWRGEGGG